MRSSTFLGAAGLTALVVANGCAAMMGQGSHENMEKKDEVARATAAIAGPGGLAGTATLVEVAQGSGRAVRVLIALKGDPAVLTPGRHGVHFHAVGDCQAPFTSAGGHFDPGPSGNMDPDMNHPFHMGDLPNLEVNERGEGRLDAWTTRVTLSDGPLSLFDANGSALIIHENADQGISGAAKSGVSGGPRIACGVITR